ncbi:MAG: hypothetical protein JSU81_01345, partial [Candidatus Coatesbacteria bacterium]
MRKCGFLISAAVLALSAAAFAPYSYEGEWGSSVRYIAVAPNGNVYGTHRAGHKVRYFSPTGTFLGEWGEWGESNGQFRYPLDIDVASNGRVYVCDYLNYRIQYFTLTGSFLGKWGSEGSGNNQFTFPRYVSIGPGGDVYVLDGSTTCRIKYYTATGSFLGKWDLDYVGSPNGLGVSPLTGRVYITDQDYDRVVYYSSTGSFLGEWGRWGSGPGQFINPEGITVSRDGRGRVFVVDTDNDRVQYFTPTGSCIGIIAEQGRFRFPLDIAVSWTGARFYVYDNWYPCVKYFKRTTPAVVPTSLGKVKTLFR